MRNGEDFIDPSLDGIANRPYASFTLEDLRFIHNTSLALQLQLDLEQLSLVQFLRVDLFVEVVQCKDNTLADSVSDDGVDILGVLLPLWFLLVELYSVVDLLK